MIERRRFLTSGTAGLVLAAAAPTLLFSVGRSEAGTQGYDRASFDDWVGSDFALRDVSGPPVRLRQVEDGPASPRVEQYRVVFEAARGTGLGEGTHALVAPDGTEIALFLKPTGAGPEGELHEAVFSQLRRVGSASC